MDVELLHHIYHFPGRDLPTSQDEKTCQRLAELFVDFSDDMIRSLGYKQEPVSGYSKAHFDNAKNFLSQAIQVSLDGPCIKWFPAYGCAAIYHSDSGQRYDYLSVDIIGIDRHELQVHVGKEDYQFSSVAKSFAILHVGEVAIFNLEGFNRRFNGILKEASQRKGDQRSAAGERQGHQRTPAFIHALFVQALSCECTGKCNCAEVLPKGGFTDVGQHTGGEARDTCFALVCSVSHWSFDHAAASDDSTY